MDKKERFIKNRMKLRFILEKMRYHQPLKQCTMKLSAEGSLFRLKT